MKHEMLKTEAMEAVRRAHNETELRVAELEYIGRSGKITTILRNVKELPERERKSIGAEMNELRHVVEEEIAKQRSLFGEEAGEKQLRAERIDITQPGPRHARGGLHVLTQVQRDMTRAFSTLGFELVEGPEIETEWYNFDALNVPKNHPARDMHDTFWLQNSKQGKNSKSQKFLLRTHTSPVQIRYMETHNPPFRIIVPGRVFRLEATDASHDIQFYQLEGLMVGRNVSLAHLKHVMAMFLRRLFHQEVTVRLRPSYFPFVEPGVEVDMSCVICGGDKKGCSVCKRTGWVEMAGAGMVHPAVFRAAGIDPRQWQGFAFGFGIDRIAMMKYRIPDIRLFYEGDSRFLRQF